MCSFGIGMTFGEVTRPTPNPQTEQGMLLIISNASSVERCLVTSLNVPRDGVTIS